MRTYAFSLLWLFMIAHCLRVLARNDTGKIRKASVDKPSMTFVESGHNSNKSSQTWNIGTIDMADADPPRSDSPYGVRLSAYHKKFTLRNISKKDIRLLQTYSDCSCVSDEFLQNDRPVPSPVTIKPGKTIDVLLQFSSSLLSPGRVTSKLSLLDIDKAEVASWKIIAEKTGVITYSVPHLEFGDVPFGQRREKNFRLILNRKIGSLLPPGEPLVIRSSNSNISSIKTVVEGKAPHVRAAKDRISIAPGSLTEEKDMVFLVTAALSDSSPVGRIKGRIYLSLDRFPQYIDLMNQDLEILGSVVGNSHRATPSRH